MKLDKIQKKKKLRAKIYGTLYPYNVTIIFSENLKMRIYWIRELGIS